MYLIRRAKLEDVATLTKLGKMVFFINLPPDKDIISQKVIHSRDSFIRAADENAQKRQAKAAQTASGLAEASANVDLFMFVLEDTETGNCLGTSQLVAQMGGPGNPNISFKLEKRSFFSETLQTGTSHVVAKLYEDESGPTEIGGLILQPSLRGHKRKLGRFLALIRFHFIALRRQLFADRLLGEMMAPITPEGANVFWEALGRRFIPLSYDEADRFCQISREFMTSLLPREEIYLSLLPPTARAVVGQVNPETVPARKMLEKLGFQYKNFIDPFDGGPHLEAVTDEVPTIRDTRRMTLGEPLADGAGERWGIVSAYHQGGDFLAVHEPISIEGDRVRLGEEAMRTLRVQAGAAVGVTPLEDIKKKKAQAAAGGAAAGGTP